MRVDKRRVVVTGLGAITPIGNTTDEFWEALRRGKSGIGPITKFDSTGYPTRIAGEVRGFDPLKFVDKKEARRLDPFVQYAIASSVMAVEDSGLDLSKVDGTRFGVLVGSGIGGISNPPPTPQSLPTKGTRSGSPLLLPPSFLPPCSRPR